MVPLLFSSEDTMVNTKRKMVFCLSSTLFNDQKTASKILSDSCSAIYFTLTCSCSFVSGSMTDLSELDISSFCYPLEETLAADVVTAIAQSLSDASHTSLDCSKLILPDCLLHNISQELLHLAAIEPCGLKGALIDLCVDMGEQDSPCTVDQIAVDPSLVPTFHVTLVMRVESSGLWPKHHNTLKLSTSFRAIKRKLYSSAALLVEEC
uniref:DNA damage-inducible transcript 4 protein n=1 Tax=Amphilophus citrinellus TaxID=61819 RepID=A0A3Q0SSY3_AMPCI